jgi:hypothetical protein
MADTYKVQTCAPECTQCGVQWIFNGDTDKYIGTYNVTERFEEWEDWNKLEKEKHSKKCTICQVTWYWTTTTSGITWFWNRCEEDKETGV